jgi:hypothetical protein
LSLFALVRDFLFRFALLLGDLSLHFSMFSDTRKNLFNNARRPVRDNAEDQYGSRPTGGEATYRFTFIVNGDGVSKTKRVDVIWKGKWDSIEAVQVVG